MHVLPLGHADAGCADGGHLELAGDDCGVGRRSSRGVEACVQGSTCRRLVVRWEVGRMTATSEGIDASVRSAVLATYAVFIGSGLAFASWASRIPQVRDRFRLDPSEFGHRVVGDGRRLGHCTAAVRVIIGHFGSRWTVRTTALLVAVGMAVVSLGYLVGDGAFGDRAVLVRAGGMGAWDVGMNVQGALAERRLGRAIMPRFHAGFSVGTVAGALIGAGMVALQGAGSCTSAGRGCAGRRAVYRSPHADPCPTTPNRPSQRAMLNRVSAVHAGSALHAWREPRTLLIGLFVLAFAFAEGTGNDWIGIALIDGSAPAPPWAPSVSPRSWPQ